MNVHELIELADLLRRCAKDEDGLMSREEMILAADLHVVVCDVLGGIENNVPHVAHQNDEPPVSVLERVCDRITKECGLTIDVWDSRHPAVGCDFPPVAWKSAIDCVLAIIVEEKRNEHGSEKNKA